jgi:ABC-type sugar transport system ATPase subunit
MNSVTTTDLVLELRSVSKSYPGVKAVQNVDIALASSEVVGLVGKNGAGKSTLIKIMAGLVRPDSGQFFSVGANVELTNSDEASALGLAFVHQELSLVASMTVAENVFLGAGYPRGPLRLVDWAALRRQSDAALERLGVSINPKAITGGLSTAQQRMVMIARALVQDARILVLDEPTAALTAQETDHLFAVIESLRKDGVAILYVSHRLDEILDITDRTVVMRDGRVVDTRPTSEHDSASLVECITGEASAVESDTVHMRRESVASHDVVLSVANLSRHGVIHDVSFEVRAGEILGIAGLVGAGRTELVEAIFGVAQATSGTVSVHGTQIKLGSTKAAMNAGIVLLPEDRKRQGNIIEMDIAKNISMPNLPKLRAWSRLPFLSPSRETSAARSQMTLLKVKAGSPSVLVSQLSGGNQQKVLLGKWLLHGAEVFIFDEPTQGIDVQGRQDVYDVIGRLASEGKAVIFISSDFAELVGACHRAVVLVDGIVRGELEGEQLTERGILERCYQYAAG